MKVLIGNASSIVPANVCIPNNTASPSGSSATARSVRGRTRPTYKSDNATTWRTCVPRNQANQSPPDRSYTSFISAHSNGRKYAS